jgi:hypothetical protein
VVADLADEPVVGLGTSAGVALEGALEPLGKALADDLRASALEALPGRR